MYNNTAVLLNKLHQVILQLTDQVKQYQHITLTNECFDISLFKHIPAKASYNFYLAEIEQNYQNLVDLINKNDQTHAFEAIQYLSERVCHQIEALTRQLANIDIHIEEKPFNPNLSSALYEKYHTNLEYLRRLQIMKYELQQSNDSRSILTKKTVALEQRITRCKQAIAEIEKQLESF